MDNVSLTYFVNFVLKVGTPKTTVVREFKSREYDPQFDFYKGLREKIGDVFRGQDSLRDMDTWASGVHEKKRAAYLAVVAGLRKFVGRRPQFAWFDPPRENFAIGDLTLNVNPELGLEIEGVPHIVKLYLKDDPPLVRNRAQLTLRVLEQALSAKNPHGTFAILDARKGRLHPIGSTPVGIDALLAGEAAAFKTMYDTI